MNDNIYQDENDLPPITKSKRDCFGDLFTTKGLMRATAIAALYVVLTIIPPFSPLASGLLQFRVSEALTIMPLFFLSAVPGLAVGCLVANIVVGKGIFDIILGPLASLVAATVTYIIGRLIKKDALRVGLGILPPILVNAFVVPVIFILANLEYGYWISVLFVGLGQTGVLVILGVPLYFSLSKLRGRAKFLQ